MNDAKSKATDKLLAAHKVLLKELEGLAEFCRGAVSERPEVLKRLETTRKTLKEHFQLEEQDGYLKQAFSGDLRAAQEVDGLRQDHWRLAEALDELVAEAQAKTELKDDFRERVRAWLKQLNIHEAREDALVQDAVNLAVPAID